MDKYIDVVGAVIIRDGSVLCARRGEQQSMAGMWEFPGGKIEPGETPQRALAREIVEELGCEIMVGDKVVTTTFRYDFGTIRLTTYVCTLVSGAPEPTEHAEVRWVPAADLESLEWAAADIPAVELIRDRWES